MEQQGLLGALRKFREDLVSEFGLGAAGLADERMREKLGIGLKQRIEQRRQEILVQRYLQQKLYPRIEVTRREVERYYRNHPEQFNPPAEVTLRILFAETPDAIEQAGEALAEGKPFAEVARQYSTLNPEQGGLLPPFSTDLQDFDRLAWDAVDEAVRQLKPEPGHRTTPKIEVDGGAVWVHLEKLQRAEGRSLSEVYLQIERGLREREFEQLNREYISRLIEEGNFTPIEQMLATLPPLPPRAEGPSGLGVVAAFFQTTLGRLAH